MPPTRITALFVMTIITTATPAIYQVGIEPRVAGANCDITITSLQLDRDNTEEGVAMFKAYLRVDNRAPVDVILSQLTLDVYHYSSVGRFQLIGTMNTTQEYQVPANGHIQSTYENGVVSNIYPADNDRTVVYAKLAFYQDKGGGHATTEALADLISRGYLSLYLKGKAEVGPFAFKYQRYQTLTANFWDPNFVIIDVFPYLPDPDVNWNPHYTTPEEYADSGIGKYVIHAKMHNPSGIPFVLNQYNFSLVDDSNNIRAIGIDSFELLDTAYDPDVRQPGTSDLSREKISTIFKSGVYQTTFSADQDEWQDIFFGFDFTDYDPTHYSPGHYLEPNQLNSKTRENIYWFFNKLLTQPILSGITLRGKLNMLLGWYDGARAKGVSIDVGSTDPNNRDFEIFNAKFYQQHYSEYDGAEPVSIQQLITPGQVHVESIEIDSSSKDITFNMSSQFNFTNPYRLPMDFTDLTTNYYRIDKQNEYNYLEQYNFGTTGTPDLRKITINRATRANSIQEPTLTPGYTIIDHNFTMTYNTETYEGNSAISKILTDMDIDDTIVNWTNPFKLMSPEDWAMDVNPLVIMKALIQKGLDPLMQLNKTDVTYARKADGDAYFPLNCMFFGSRDGRSYWEQKARGVRLGESEDLQIIDGTARPSSYSYAFRIIKPFTVGANWATFADYSGRWQYVYASRDPSYNNGLWTYDSNRNGFVKDINGLLTYAFTGLGDYPGIGSNLPSEILWRIYNRAGSDAANYRFGYWYDWEELLRNYYIVFDPNSGDSSTGMAFSQNFTLLDPNDPDAPQGITGNDVIKATMSISYRYPLGGAATGRFGIGQYQDLGGNAYSYNYTHDYPGIGTVTDSSTYEMFMPGSTLYGVILDNPTGTKQWIHKVIDITDYIKSALNSGNPNDRKLEVSFGTSSGTHNVVYFDDVQVYIEYRDPNPTNFEISELFKYSEEKDPVEGNMWQFLSDINFDATNFAAFLDNDPAKASDGKIYNMGLGTEQPDLLSYLQGQNVDLIEMTNIMEHENEVYDAPEPMSFLELLNHSRYIINPHSTTAEFVNGLGWRDELGNYWVVEDPYRLSKQLSDALTRYIHLGDDGYVSPTDRVGEELWLMLDNLNIYFPWVLMYLMSHGWTKDDIFDALEALGFASEVKENWNGGQDSGGQLNTRIQIVVIIDVFGITSLISDPVTRTFQFPMGKTVNNGYQKLFEYLMDYGETHNYGSSDIPLNVPNSRTLVYTSSNLPGDPVPDIDLELDFDVLWFTVTVHTTVQMRPLAFSLAMWMEDLHPNHKPAIAPAPDLVVASENPYMGGQIVGANNIDGEGFNDIGSQVLGSLVRQHYLFQGEPFIHTGGDPIGLFQFLDNYYFTGLDLNNDQVIDHDYSSYVLLDYFNVKSKDFIDLITGYNWMYDTFDGHPDPRIGGNGLVDDWVAPLDYGGGYSRGLGSTANHSASYNGWGYDFWDGRIFWHPLDNNYFYNGHIIWSDSPTLLDFVDDNTDRVNAHQRGEVYYQSMGDGPGNDRPWEGAPPCLNLIDMLLWLAETTHAIDSNDIFKWIIGELDSSYYDSIKPRTGPSGPELWGPAKNRGIGNQRLWGTLQNSTFNVTGMFNFLENLKGADPFKLMWELDTRTGTPDPQNLMFWALNPNWIMTPDGHIQFMYHDALGKTVGESKQFLWQMFNASYWKDHGEPQLWDYLNDPEDTLPYIIFGRFRELELNGTTDPKDPNRVLDFNLWNMFLNLYLDPMDWWDDIQYTDLGITPLNVLYASDKLNLTKKIQDAAFKGKSTKMKINGTMNIEIFGFPLTLLPGWDLTFYYNINPQLFTAAYHFINFIDPDELYRTTFIIK
ncbi:MAG: hypothetical protein ACTSRZ_01265 [Promethearchaeota archaeon]